MRVAKKLRSANRSLLSTIDRYRAKILGAVLAALVIGYGAFVTDYIMGPLEQPRIAREFAQTSVMVTNREKTAGGSGVILRSSNSISEILTNKHVCRVIEHGGVITRGTQTVLITKYKKFPDHDLCLLQVQHNMGVSIKVADSPPTDFEGSFISGHPALLPHVLTQGNFSGRRIIDLLIGLTRCTKEDLEGENAGFCFFFGGIPVVHPFEGQLVTGTILPGSSGSGVFNADGELAGLVFAGQGSGLGYAFVVPYEYIVEFLKMEKAVKYTPVVTDKPENMVLELLNVENKCQTGSSQDPKVMEFCSNLLRTYLWTEK